jgi:hypothetical protein
MQVIFRNWPQSGSHFERRTCRIRSKTVADTPTAVAQKREEGRMKHREGEQQENMKKQEEKSKID